MAAILSLDGPWKLYYFRQGSKSVHHPDDLSGSGLLPIAAKVPGNVELDLVGAGLLPDPYVGENIHQLRALELNEWWYERAFAADEAIAGAGKVELVFHGVDCFATYWLNGREIGSSDNMFIEHRFNITGMIEPGKEHTLVVRLRSAVLEAMSKVYEPSHFTSAAHWEQLWVRKAPHSFGWDIFPRALSAGLWRSVEIAASSVYEITDVYVATRTVTRTASGSRATMSVHFQIDADPEQFPHLRIRLKGRCGSSGFEAAWRLYFTAGHFTFDIPDPELWWPRGYGEAKLYEATAEILLHEETVAVKSIVFGVRTVELLRSESTSAETPGQFMFKVNSVPVMVKGANWVPADIFHSKDAERYRECLGLFVDLNCNMLRSWGGGVYEDHAFFDLCDRAGIMVWQDFAMACASYPQSPEFQDTIRKEAAAVIRKLRQHPSLAVWCADNENDEVYVRWRMNPNFNQISRKLLPEVAFECDPYRPYVPGSPYVSELAFRRRNVHFMPERHLWGPRDYYKSSFYSAAKAHFIGEIGYHGCPNLASIAKFIDPEYLWPWQNNKQWITHCTDPLGPDGPYAYRVKLMADQINELFGEYPERIEDFILASQISQAEAKKFFIETARLKKWDCTGILWWNVVDGWPQFSDAVVDYYMGKKLAYHYIQRVQQPFCIMVDEPESWHVRAVAGNDSNEPARGVFRVWDADSGETLLAGEFRTEANGTQELGKIRSPRSAQRMLLIEWETNGRRYGNHYLLGSPGFSLKQYRSWLDRIAALPMGFDPERIGRE